MATPSAYLVNDSNFFTALLPNRGRARFVRAAILLFLAGGALGWIAIAALCEGIARTRTTDSETLANSWFERHRFNPPVGVLHDPKGPGVKIVGEPTYLVYP